MNRYFTILFILFSITICQNTAYAQAKVLTEATPAAGGFSAARLARLDSSMNNWVKQKWLNGSVVLIARHGKVVFYKAHGYNDLTTKEPLSKLRFMRKAMSQAGLV